MVNHFSWHYEKQCLENKNEFLNLTCAPHSQLTSLGELMKDVVEREEDVFNFNERGYWRDIRLDSGEVVMFEICEDIAILPAKVFQVERALQLRESCIGAMPIPKAVGVIFNGERSKFNDVVRKLTKTPWPCDVPKPKVFDLPFFLIYSSYTNIFGEVRKLSGEVRKLSDKVDKLSDKVDKLSDKVDKLSNTFLQLLSRSQLVRMCNIRGISISKKATTDDLMAALSRET